MDYPGSAAGIFRTYKKLGETSLARISDADLAWSANDDCNSAAVIVKHMHGNMMSRWTDFLTTDGEKPWRERDAEFENTGDSRESLMVLWETGWNKVFETLSTLSAADLECTVYIRGEAHTVVEAINRQIAHYAYHVGQIVYIAKLRGQTEWEA
jgi:hypothetical protein